MKPALAALCLVAGVLSLSATAQDAKPSGVFANKFGTGELYCVKIPENPTSDWINSRAWDNQVFGDRGPCDPNLEYVDQGTWGRSVLVSGVDTEGRRADFRFYVLNERYAWALGSASRIEDAGKPANFGALLGTPEFFSRVCSGDGVMGVGAASYEGETAANHILAGTRSKVIAGQAKTVVSKCEGGNVPEVYNLNLGEHKKDDVRDTSPQRKVVVIVVRNSETGVNLTEALKNAVGETELIDGFKLADYDLLDLATYTE